MALTVVNLGSEHAHMGRWIPHFALHPGAVCLEGGVNRWLVGVAGLGAELLQRQRGKFECLRKTRGVRAFVRGLGAPKALPGWLSYGRELDLLALLRAVFFCEMVLAVGCR
jgi:hypothetical protein